MLQAARAPGTRVSPADNMSRRLALISPSGLQVDGADVALIITLMDWDWMKVWAGLQDATPRGLRRHGVTSSVFSYSENFGRQTILATPFKNK